MFVFCFVLFTCLLLLLIVLESDELHMCVSLITRFQVQLGEHVDALLQEPDGHRLAIPGWRSNSTCDDATGTYHARCAYSPKKHW